MMEKIMLRLSKLRSGSHILRVVAGAYLIYLSYGILFQDTSSKPLIVNICAVLFVIFGLFVGGASLFALCTGRFLEQVQSDEAAAREAEESENTETVEEYDDLDTEDDS